MTNRPLSASSEVVNERRRWNQDWYTWLNNLATDVDTVTELETDVSNLETSVTTLQVNVTTLQGQVSTLQGQVTTLQGQVSTLQSNVTTLQGQVSTLQGQVSTLQGQVTTLQSNVTALQSTVNSLQAVPVTITAATFTVTTETEIIGNRAGTITLTLPAPTANQSIRLKTITANSIVSSLTNILPLGTNVAQSQIVPAVAGTFRRIVADGTNWVMMAGN